MDLGEYTYSYGMKGFEEESNQLWVDFGNNIKRFMEVFDSISFFIILLPTSVTIDPDNHVHSLSSNLRFDCATIDSVKRLKNLAEDLKFHFINPTEYMKKHFNLYYLEDNPERFYFIDDSNHFNKTGSEFFAEYTYHETFDKAYN